MKMEDDKGFEIKCLNCGSINIDVHADVDYDYDGNPYIGGYYIECNNCGQVEDI